MPELSQKGIAHLFLLIVLLVGILGGVYMVTAGPLKFRPKASVSGPAAPSTAFSLAPDNTSATKGQQFQLKVMVSSDVSATNLFTAKIKFNKDLLEVESLDYSGTFIKNWIEQQHDNATGEISLVGGLPTPGLQTTAGNPSLMAIINFKALEKEGDAIVSFTDESAVFDNANNLNILNKKSEAKIKVGLPKTEGGALGPGPFIFNFTNTDVTPTKITCKKGDASCRLKVMFSGTNRLDKRLHRAIFDAANPALQYRDFDTNMKTGRGIPMRLPVEPKAEAFNGVSIIFTPPVNEDVTTSLLLSADTCVTDAPPTNCSAAGISNITVKKTTSGETVTLEAINNSPDSKVPTTSPVPTPTITPVPVPVPVVEKPLSCENYGDLNLDGKITKEDVEIGLQITLGKINANSSGKEYMRVVGDVNNDEQINIKDVEIIQRYLEGGTNTFPACASLKAAPCDSLVGDVTGNGNISKIDAQEVLNIDLGYPNSIYTSKPYTAEQKKRADTDGSGSISPVDSLNVLRYLKGEINTFKACGGSTPAPSATPSPKASGDGNNNGKIDMGDISVLLSDFNKDKNIRGNVDLNSDGKINSFDVSLMRNLLIEKKVIKGS